MTGGTTTESGDQCITMGPAIAAAVTDKDIVKKYYAMLHVEKEDLLARLKASQEKLLTQEIQKMLEERDGQEVASCGSTADLPRIRVLPLTDQLRLLEKTLAAYVTTLRRCVDNLQRRLHDFRLDDSCVGK